MNQRIRVSRREWLKRVSEVGAVAAMPPEMLLPLVSPDARADALLQGQPTASHREPLETLTESEAATLEAITARLIPSDSTGPGAVEAQAYRYIDRGLGGALASVRDAYRSGLAALDRYAESTKSRPFVRLSADEQDAVLRDVESNTATGFSPSAAAFFNLVLAHTIQGTFCDPYYGGNANFVGWDLIGYPGVRLAVRAEEQALTARPAPTHMSAYDYRMFSGRKPARAALRDGGGHHGD
jgi:gluconate 2-dehydrogenase gamma chain